MIPTGQCVLLKCAFSLLLASFAAAQTPLHRYHVVVAVTDRRDHYVTQMRPADFVVDVNGVRTAVSSLALSTQNPKTVGIILDANINLSFTMGAELKTTAKFIENMPPKDTLFLMTAEPFGS